MKHFLLFFTALFLSLSAYAGGGHGNHGKNDEHDPESIDAGSIILNHIADSHDFHLLGHTHIPLPVIIYNPSEGRGLDVFMSSEFEHGEKVVRGYTIDHHMTKILCTGGSTFYDLSITKNVFTLLLAVVILLCIFLPIASKYKKNGFASVPSGIQSFFEPIIVFIRDEVAKPYLGDKSYKYLPYLLTLFFFIWIINMLGLIPFFPGSANVTGNISITLVLAVITFLITQFSGNKHYWGHILTPDVPIWLYPIVVPVEILGIFTKPFALMVRLFANIAAGHIIILSLVCLVFIFGKGGAIYEFNGVVSCSYTSFYIYYFIGSIYWLSCRRTSLKIFFNHSYVK